MAGGLPLSKDSTLFDDVTQKNHVYSVVAIDPQNRLSQCSLRRRAIPQDPAARDVERILDRQ
jgi:hypothetical protein